MLNPAYETSMNYHECHHEGHEVMNVTNRVSTHIGHIVYRCLSRCVIAKELSKRRGTTTLSEPKSISAR